MRKKVGALGVLVVLLVLVVPMTVVAQAGTTSTTNSGMTKEERQAAFAAYAERNSADSGQANADTPVQAVQTVTATATPTADPPGGGKVVCKTRKPGGNVPTTTPTADQTQVLQCQGGSGGKYDETGYRGGGGGMFRMTGDLTVTASPTAHGNTIIVAGGGGGGEPGVVVGGSGGRCVDSFEQHKCVGGGSFGR